MLSGGCALNILHVIPIDFRQTTLGAQAPLTERMNMSLPQALLFTSQYTTPYNPLKTNLLKKPTVTTERHSQKRHWQGLAYMGCSYSTFQS